VDRVHKPDRPRDVRPCDLQNRSCARADRTIAKWADCLECAVAEELNLDRIATMSRQRRGVAACCFRLFTFTLAALTVISASACERTTPTCPTDLPAEVAGPARMRVGEDVQLQVTETFYPRANLMQPSANPSSWTSSDPAVLTVSVNGLARGVAPGRVTVTVKPWVRCGVDEIRQALGTLAITVVP
jgi:hypothetical protein